MSGCVDVRYIPVQMSGCVDVRYIPVEISGCVDVRYIPVQMSGCPIVGVLMSKYCKMVLKHENDMLYVKFGVDFKNARPQAEIRHFD